MSSILDLPPDEFLFALDELRLPDDQREFLLSRYGVPEPRPPVPDDRSFGYHLLDNLIGFDDDYVTRGEAWRAGVQDTLSEFVSPEAGQRRRAALDRVDQRINDALDYYLGPQLAPRVQQAADLGGLLSPGADVVDAYQASGDLMAPNRTPLDRAASGAALAGSLAAMLMPGGVSSIRQGVEDVADAAVRAYDPATTNAFTVWHGSPHDFDRFDLSKIGTGEGAQAYGHGLYFAESPDVARGYRDRLSTFDPYGARRPSIATVDGVPAKELGQDIWEVADQMASRGMSIDEYIQDLSKRIAATENPARADVFLQLKADAERVAERLRGRDVRFDQGRLYEVSIDANPEDFLDWDRPLSEQPEAVRDALTGIYPDDMMGGEIARLMASDARDTAIMRGDNARTSLAASQAAASEGLRKLGIPGIRYLDAGSRGAGEGSRNYVVFDDQLLSILNKYGLAGGVGLASLALMGEEDSADNY